MLLNLYAGNSTKSDLCLFAANNLWFTMNHHFFLIINDYLVGKDGIAVT